MLFKHSVATTAMVGSILAMAACQASFQAGTGPAATPSATPATGEAAAAPAATVAAPATTESPAPAPAETATSAPAPAPTLVSLAGGKIVLKNRLTFDSGKPILLSTPENEAILADIKLFLDQTPKLTQMRIEGHTDNVGAADANLALSGQRALTIKNALIERGIAKERLVAVGFGDKKPLADNATEAGRAQNQRLEFRVATWNGKNYLNQPPTGGGTVVE